MLEQDKIKTYNQIGKKTQEIGKIDPVGAKIMIETVEEEKKEDNIEYKIEDKIEDKIEKIEKMVNKKKHIINRMLQGYAIKFNNKII